MKVHKYKVPFRMVYCETLRGWLAETIFCHIVLPLSHKPVMSPIRKKVR